MGKPQLRAIIVAEHQGEVYYFAGVVDNQVRFVDMPKIAMMFDDRDKAALELAVIRKLDPAHTFTVELARVTYRGQNGSAEVAKVKVGS